MIGALLVVPGLVLVREPDAEDEAKQNGRADRADHAQRIGAGIGNGNVFAVILEEIERLLRRAEARRVRDGAVVHAQHLRERHDIGEQEVEPDRDRDAQKHLQHGQKIENHAAALEGREKGRADLKADEEDKERQAEVAQEKQDGLVHGEAEMARRQRHEEHEGHAERHAENLETAEHGSQGNDQRVNEKDVRDRGGVRQQMGNPIHGGFEKVKKSRFRLSQLHAL